MAGFNHLKKVSHFQECFAALAKLLAVGYTAAHVHSLVIFDGFEYLGGKKGLIWRGIGTKPKSCTSNFFADKLKK